MEAVGLILVVLIIIGAGTGVAALINSYLLQRNMLKMMTVISDLYSAVHKNHEEIRKCQKE